MSETPQILIYTEPMNSSTAKALRKAGVIPVRVQDANSVRLLNAETSVLPADALLRSLLDAMCSDLSWSDKRLNRFVKNLRLYAPMNAEPKTPEV